VIEVVVGPVVDRNALRRQAVPVIEKVDEFGAKPVATFFSISLNTASWSGAASVAKGAPLADCA
jgi:hypothetical protein